MAEPQSQNDWQVWLKRIAASKSERENHASEWRSTLKRMAGRRFRKGFAADETGLINLANNYVRLLLPHLLGRDQVLRCTATPKRGGPEYADGAEQLGDRVTAVMGAIRMVETARQAIKAGMYSAGILKYGMQVKTGIRKSVPTSDGGAETVDVDGDRAEGEEYLDAGLPFCSWVPAMRFYPDSGSTDLDNCRWVGHRLFRTLEAVRADPRFAAVAEQLQASHSSAPRELGGAANTGDADRGDDDRKDPRLGLISFYEIYDRHARRVLYVPDEGAGVQQILAEGEWPAGIEGFPFTMFVWDWVEDFFWPNPLLAVQGDLMACVDGLAETVREASEEARTVYAYDPGEIKSESLRAIESAPHGAFVPVPGMATRNFQAVELGGANKSQWEGLQLFKGFADEMSGVREFQRGVTSAGAKPTATEVSAAATAYGNILGDAKAEVMSKLGRGAEMIGALLMSNAQLLQETSLPAGQGKEQRPVDFSAPIAGETIDYLYEAAVGEQPKTDPAILQKRTQDLIGQSLDPTMTQKLQAEGKALLTAPLVERQLDLIGEKSPEKFFIDVGGGQGQQEQAHAESAEMAQSGQPLPVGPDDDHAAHLEAHAADYEQSQSEAIGAHMMAHEQAAQQAPQGPAASGAPVPASPPSPSPAGGPGGSGVDQAAAIAAAARR